MQYGKPEGDCYVGDCMPFHHDGTFRLYYLLDRDHHGALGGLGGHQWAQASTTDLVRWVHHPLAIPITEEREGSICTGSAFFHEGLYYGFYATRMRDRTQHLGLALSRDGVHFEKTEPNPFASPPAGYDPLHYRDPVVFREAANGPFHMLVTARLEDGAIAGRGGCLAHLVSGDLRRWEHRGPFLIPGLPGVPECPDFFAWNGWHYLVFSNGGVARYRMARGPLGPWIRPRVDTLDGPAARVMKTAAFAGGRRLGVAWLGTRRDDRDDGPFQFGGNAIFRELVQHGDGTLGARHPAEMISGGEPLPGLNPSPLGAGAQVEGCRIRLTSRQGLAAAACDGIPQNLRLVLRVSAHPDSGEFGLRLRAGETLDSGYDLAFSPRDGVVTLNAQRIQGVEGLDKPFELEAVLRGDILDACVDGRRTILDRCPGRRGDRLYFYGQDAEVDFEVTEATALGRGDGSWPVGTGDTPAPAKERRA
jgi:beta-fructofuranosidase